MGLPSESDNRHNLQALIKLFMICRSIIEYLTEVCTKRFWDGFIPPNRSVDGTEPEKLPKAHSNAHAKAIIVRKTATVKRK